MTHFLLYLLAAGDKQNTALTLQCQVPCHGVVPALEASSPPPSALTAMVEAENPALNIPHNHLK